MRDEKGQSKEAVFFWSSFNREWRGPNDRLLRHHEQTKNKNKTTVVWAMSPKLKVLKAGVFHLGISIMHLTL